MGFPLLRCWGLSLWATAILARDGTWTLPLLGFKSHQGLCRSGQEQWKQWGTLGCHTWNMGSLREVSFDLRPLESEEMNEKHLIFESKFAVQILSKTMPFFLIFLNQVKALLPGVRCLLPKLHAEAVPEFYVLGGCLATTELLDIGFSERKCTSSCGETKGKAGRDYRYQLAPVSWGWFWSLNT